MTVCKAASLIYPCDNGIVGNSWGRDWLGLQSCRTELFLMRLAVMISQYDE